MSSIEFLFKEYYLKLSDFAYRWVNSEDIAKDIVQDAFMVLIEKEAMLERPAIVLKSFLYSTVKNLSINYIRHEQIAARINNVIGVQELNDEDILKNMIQAEIIGELYQELERLPNGCKHICKLIYFEDKKYHEVASEMDMSVNTVKTQRQRALRILKSKFLSFFIFLITYWLFINCVFIVTF